MAAPLSLAAGGDDKPTVTVMLTEDLQPGRLERAVDPLRGEDAASTTAVWTQVGTTIAAEGDARFIEKGVFMSTRDQAAQLAVLQRVTEELRGVGQEEGGPGGGVGRLTEGEFVACA